MAAASRRVGWIVTIAVAALISAGIVVAVDRPAPDGRPNVIVVLTDDQTADTLPTRPPAMPWLESQIGDPAQGWVTFPSAIAATPMCCPSRASVLTGLVADHHGVTSNDDGTDLDERDTLATWLHDAGYTTGLIGKYLNDYPWDRGPYVPPGWDRWFAKTNDSLATTYLGYGVVDQGIWRRFGSDDDDYVTDVLGREAVTFVRSAPRDRPWFLYFAPPAGHAPWMPAPRHAGALGHDPPAAFPDEVLNDVDDLPAWVRALPPIDDVRAAQLQQDRIRARETLLSVDEQLEAIWRTVVARGEQDRTVVIVLSDNGFQFGEHRWVGKQTPFEPSLRIPFVVRSPWRTGGAEEALVSTIDIAPTIASLAGLPHPSLMDGVSLARALHGTGPVPSRLGVPISWSGSQDVPAWSGLRTDDVTYVRWADGTTEVYRLRDDPEQLHPLEVRPRRRFEAELDHLLGSAG